MHRTYSLRYGSFHIRKLIRTRFFAHHRRNIRKYNTRYTFFRNCVTVMMYRCEMASQRNKNQCHSLYRFWINWFLPRLHVEEMLDFDGSGYFADCKITWSVYKRFYLYSSYPIEGLNCEENGISISLAVATFLEIQYFQNVWSLRTKKFFTLFSPKYSKYGLQSR